MLLVNFTEPLFAAFICLSFRFGPSETCAIGVGLLGLLVALGTFPKAVEVYDVGHNCPVTVCGSYEEERRTFPSTAR